ncbi:motile sperm domain-containing protein 2-like [Panonychus citri]|uniref:motile sperm domain-containing protein 2-like n=1 Tax=Panonychus citri TaxID=50023 RepID=UPI0023080615|nr:motile sperm domain-containing protein 2-like [Panonychus citri]
MPERDYIWPLESIDNVRQMVLDYYETDDKDSYDSTDLTELMVDNWWIKRFLIHKGGDEVEAFNMIINCLKWRKKIEIRSIKDNHFPEEIYRIGALFSYGRDQNGFPTVYIRLKMVKRLKEVSDLVKLFITYNFYKVDVESHGQGWGLIIDFNGAGLQNTDLDLARMVILGLKAYFPSSLEYVLCVDFPWILRAFWRVIKSWIPADRKFMLSFTSRNQLTSFIDQDYLPQFLGGNCKRPTNEAPFGCPKFVEYCVTELGVSKESAEKVFAQYKPYL